MNPRGAPIQSEIVQVSMLVTVSRPSEECIPAVTDLTATFLDVDENPICSGKIPDLFTQETDLKTRLGHISLIHLDVRPFNVLEFVRWRNAPVPTPTMMPARRLFCANLDGTAEVPAQEILRAATLKLHATILPKNSGVATAETKLTLIARPN